MSTQELNRSIAKRWFQEIWNEHRAETVDELAAPGTTGHLEGQGVIDMDQFKAFHAAMVGAFSDLKVDVEDTLAEGDHVVLRWRLHGTHDGDGLGFPASHQSVSIPGITWFTFQDGKLVGGSDGWNQGALLADLQAASEARGDRG